MDLSSYFAFLFLFHCHFIMTSDHVLKLCHLITLFTSSHYPSVSMSLVILQVLMVWWSDDLMILMILESRNNYIPYLVDLHRPDHAPASSSNAGIRASRRVLLSRFCYLDYHNIDYLDYRLSIIIDYQLSLHILRIIFPNRPRLWRHQAYLPLPYLHPSSRAQEIRNTIDIYRCISR